MVAIATLVHFMGMSVVTASALRIVRSNRRAAIRVQADALPWLRGAQLVHGPQVAMIDLSIGGASFELSHRICPGDRADLELIAEGDQVLSMSRIIRSEVVAVHPHGVRYRSACMFASPLPWAGRLPTKVAGQSVSLLPGAGYQSWGAWSEIAIDFRYGGRCLRGFTHGFSPASGTIDVRSSRTLSTAEKQIVPLALVRAVRVVADFEDTATQARRTDGNPDGAPVELVFKNNVRMRGWMPAYEPDAIGVWLVPERSCTAVRVFAVAAAIAEIRLLYDE